MPREVKRGSTTVKIYTSENAKGYITHTVSWWQAGLRMRKNFADAVAAEKYADRKATKLSNISPETVSVKRSDADEMRRCRQKLKQYGVTLEHAVDEFIKTRVQPKRSDRISKVVEEYIKALAARGNSTRYIQETGNRLKRFAKDIQSTLQNLDPHDVWLWLGGLDVSNRSKNNYRESILGMIRYTKNRGYLRPDLPFPIDKFRTHGGPISLLTPDEMRLLLDQAKPAMVPFVAIGGFAGLRSSEIDRLDWSEIRFDRKSIVVGADKAKTRSRRIVPISDNLMEWLLPHANKRGPVLPFHYKNPWTEVKRAAGVEGKENCLRHSFISYKLEMVSNEGEVVAITGTSTKMLHANYRELADADDAKRWFDIKPASEANVIPICKLSG